jgi:hypothetical protein
MGNTIFLISTFTYTMISISCALIFCFLLALYGVCYFFPDICPSFSPFSFFNIFKKGAELGEKCTLHTDCKNWGPDATAVACCKEKCTTKKKDWAGVGYCPAECRDAPEPLGKLGTCDSEYSWKRSEGQPCDTHTACNGWIAGKAGTLACCSGICTKQKKDWAGVGYCPAECRDAPSPLGKPGSCDSGNTWKRSEGQPCDTHTACNGWIAGKAGTLACCSGKCTKLKNDWAGVGYCPAECKGGIFKGPGTC